ncbi:helix-turn-helix domain-containing protein [Vibrio sp.]|nr:helix-turn-helix domain-containing protein [Vibrio sp.]
MKTIICGICDYPSVLKSAVYGLEEMFNLANRICSELEVPVRFEPLITASTNLPNSLFTVVILPPCAMSDYYIHPMEEFVQWLTQKYQEGSILSSACAGTFILAATGAIDSRTVTTHWSLSDKFKKQFPTIPTDTNKILINHGDIISAGGIMSWLDLGFEIIAKYSSQLVVSRLGKTLVMDTAHREQQYYKQFNPTFSHGDKAIVTVQQQMHQEYTNGLLIHELAKQANLTMRTLQRRFQKATGMNPNQYLQRLRIQHACDYLETTTYTFDWIANNIGYEDTSACRKSFINITGLTPKEFRRRFAS